MHKIDALDAVLVKPAKKAAGAVTGYFTDGDPGGGVQATVLDADWCNSVQDEILNVLAAASVTPAKSDDDQLLAAIRKLSKRSGYVLKAADYTILDDDNFEMIDVDTSGAARAITLPVAANNQRREIIIVKKGTDSNAVTVQRQGSDVINGSVTSFTIDECGAVKLVAGASGQWYRM